MPIISSLITLSDDTPTEIVGHDNMPHDVILHNHTKSSNEYIYIGGTGVSITNAIHIDLAIGFSRSQTRTVSKSEFSTLGIMTSALFY